MSSVQITVLVNGEWTTRSRDIHAVLAANREAEVEEKAPETKLPERPPVLGLLSRTALRSPMIDWIIPARVRHRDKNDVVFIGEDFLHMKEIGIDGHLRHVATKYDFGSRIRAIRVFGEPRKPAPDSSQIKIEDSESMDTEILEAIPPQVLVLTLESNALMFLYANEHRGSVSFCHRTVPLPPGTSFLEQPGKHLAVDPRSRAIAVAACEGVFLLYSTKIMSKWREDAANGIFDSTPITDERAYRLDHGIILKMEFLSPAPNDDDHVILLIIFSMGGRTRMSCYDWDASKGLDSVAIRMERQPLHKEEETPLFVVPLQQSPGFLLVAEHRISLYQDILSGAPKRELVPIHDEIPRYPGSSRRKPLWTHWARMARNWDASGRLDENFYIVREDGVVIYVQVNPATHATTTSAGQFQCTVDSAFAGLDVGKSSFALKNPDVLVAAGDMSYGELIKIGSWADESRKRSRAETMAFEYVESIPNWAPINDAIVSRLPGVQSGFERSRETLFITGGRAPYGSISELRWGFNALVGASSDLPDITGVTGIWTLYDSTYDMTFFLLSIPLRSRLVHLDINTFEVAAISSEDCGLDLENETLAACSLMSRYPVQVTHNAIRLLISNTNTILTCEKLVEFPPERPVLAAALHSQYPLIVTATRQDSHIYLELRRLVEVEGDIVFAPEITHPLKNDPTCLALIEIDHVPYVFVATSGAELLIFRASPEGFALVMEERVWGHPLRGFPVVCESVALISAGSAHGEYELVCGMRNGTILILSLSSLNEAAFGSKFQIDSRVLKTMGRTSPRVVQNDSETSSALVLCGSDICRIYYGGPGRSDLELERVWFTDRMKPGYQQSAISAIIQISLDEHARSELTGPRHLLAISGSKILIAELDKEVRAVPRRLRVAYTPYRLMYSNRLRMMVVALTKTRETKQKVQNKVGSRSVRSLIQLIGVDDESSEMESKAEEHSEEEDKSEDNMETRRIAGEYALRRNERVYALFDWTYVDQQGKKYGFVVAGTGYREADRQMGRLLFLRTRLEDHGKYTFIEAKVKELDAPVYAIALYDELRIVFTSGSSLHFEMFSPADRRWCSVLREPKVLPSAGILITVKAPLVYVSTAQDSILSYSFIDGGPGNRYLETVFSDSRQRDSLHHLIITLPPLDSDKEKHNTEKSSSSAPYPAKPATVPESHTLALVSDKSCSLAGLIQPSQRTFKSAAPTVFEATLPRSVTRIRRGHIRPPWKRTRLSLSDPMAEWNNRTGYNPPSNRLINGQAATDHDSDPIASGPGVLVNDIIGTAADGTIFNFSILDAPAWRLLKLLENLLTAKHATKTSSGNHKQKLQKSLVKLRDVDPNQAHGGHRKATSYHVNGDVLSELLEQGCVLENPSSSILFSLVTEDCEREVMELFYECFGAVFVRPTSASAAADGNDPPVLANGEKPLALPSRKEPPTPTREGLEELNVENLSFAVRLIFLWLKGILDPVI